MTNYSLGEFWAGSKAKELGLIDGIGNMFQVIQRNLQKMLKLKILRSKKVG